STPPSAAEPRSRSRGRGIVLRVAMLLAAGISLYLLAPQVLEVFSSWPKLREVRPLWFGVAIAFEATSYVSLWTLQRVALRTRGRRRPRCRRQVGVRLSRASVRARVARDTAGARARPARVLGGRAPRDDSTHAGRPWIRRGRPHRPARPRGGCARCRHRRDACLPARLLLAAAAGGRDRVPTRPPPLRGGRECGCNLVRDLGRDDGAAVGRERVSEQLEVGVRDQGEEGGAAGLEILPDPPELVIRDAGVDGDGRSS